MKNSRRKSARVFFFCIGVLRYYCEYRVRGKLVFCIAILKEPRITYCDFSNACIHPEYRVRGKLVFCIAILKEPRITYCDFSNACIPGRVSFARKSSIAPPPVEIKVILSVRLSSAIEAIVSPPPTKDSALLSPID